MPSWDRKQLDVREPFEREDIPAIVVAVQAFNQKPGPKVPSPIVADLEAAGGNQDEFNEAWERLYNWADYARVWVATF